MTLDLSKWPNHWQSDDGAITLINADCLEVLPCLEPGSVDAVIDPPYGIGEAAGANKSRSLMAVSKDYGNHDWDNRPRQDIVDAVVRASRWQIVFGGNYYQLPPASCWLVWDKLNGDNDFADCELAWTNLKKAVRRIRYRWHGMLRENREPRGDHPTQKPVGVMAWAIEHLPDDGLPVCDCVMGSGTTGVACIRTGRRFVGIEISADYYEIAKKRIMEELDKKQGTGPLMKASLL